MAVVGGGDVAVEDAIFLSRMCKKKSIYFIVVMSYVQSKYYKNNYLSKKNVEMLWNTEMKEVAGGEQVEKIMVLNNKTDETFELPVDGVFVGIGTEPNSKLAIDKVTCDERGYVMAGESCETSVKGVFAAGDVRQKTLRQIITAAADGATSVYGAERHILENF